MICTWSFDHVEGTCRARRKAATASPVFHFLEAQTRLGEALQRICRILCGFLNMFPCLSEQAHVLDAAPRSEDVCSSGGSVDAVASSTARDALGIGALSSFSDEAQCEILAWLRSFSAACQTGYSLDTCMGSGYIGSFEMLLYDYEEGQ